MTTGVIVTKYCSLIFPVVTRSGQPTNPVLHMSESGPRSIRRNCKSEKGPVSKVGFPDICLLK